MNVIFAVALALLLVIAALFAATHVGAWLIGRAHPPIGQFATVNGTRLHYLREEAGKDADLPPVVFLHGASGNLKDQAGAFLEPLRGCADLIFLDRPGHGWSERGPESNDWPDGQAATIAALLDKLGIDRAIVVGHSFGAVTAASFALNHQDKAAGALFLAPATHPWPGGIDWYYHVAVRPILGRLFAHTLVLPIGMSWMSSGIEAVFTPNEPVENYRAKSGVTLILRPGQFRANAFDVVHLHEYVTRMAPRYREITARSVVISGDHDAIVAPGIHSIGLENALQDVELVPVANLGHKPDYIATDLAVAALEKIAGKPRDLRKFAHSVEARIAKDNFGPVERCLGWDSYIPESPSEPI